MSAIFILDQKGNPIIQRSYKGDIPLNAIQHFTSHLNNQDNYSQPPVFQKDGIFFLHIKHNNLYIVTATRKDENAMLLLSFLHKTTQVFEDYFNKLSEDSLRKNFVLVYELLDEMMDFGVPQTTDAKVLKDYICIPDRFKVKVAKPPSTVTNAVSWRSEGIEHSKNEIFLDVVEEISLMIDPYGKVVQSEINGKIKMKSFLSGMPELKLGLNDKLIVNRNGVELDDIKLHQCVRLSKFETDRTISFIPPDGEFDLMNYRLNTHVRPPFSVKITTDHRPLHGVDYFVSIQSEFKRTSSGNNVEVIVPVPSDADSPRFQTTVGSASYNPSKNHFVWTISQFSGSSKYELKAKFGLPKIPMDEEEAEQTVYARIRFDIPYYTVSGITVRYLKIMEKSGYSALPWVRYATRDGDYLVRMRLL